MFRRASFMLSVLSGLLMASGLSARADIISTFDTNDEGWQVVSFRLLASDDYSIVGTYAPTYHATGGNPGGYISSDDPDGGDFTFSAPTKFLGDVSTATGLSYDLTHPVGAIDYQTSDVIMEGGGVRLLWRSIPDLVPGAGWTPVSLSFTPSASWLVGTTNGALATAADFQTVLGNLTGLYIRGEYTNGGETAGLDNVVLNVNVTSVPEPSAFAIFSIGIVSALAVLRRGRKTSAHLVS